MNENVFDLAQADTSLTRKTYKEYAGPCPRCKSTDSFVVQPSRKEHGAWMCRRCWDPALEGWGDNIEYLRQMRGMSFTEAKNYLNGELDSLIERTEHLKPYLEPPATGRNEPPNDKWQGSTKRFIEQSIARLWSSAGKQGLDYLHDRGLKDAIIKAAQLGYEEVDAIPYVVIPWHVGNGQYWRVNKRDIRPGVPHDQRYKNRAGSSNAGLYGGELLSRKYPTFLVEGELDALSIAQEAGDLPINVVATGGLDCSRVPRWVARLARVPHVLVAYDNEQKGEEASHTWLKILTQNALRYRPLAKDANAMLLQGWNIRTWVQGALDLLSEPVEQEAQKTVDSCWDCGLESWVITDTNEAYCESCWYKRHPELQEQEQEEQQSEQLMSKEQFQAIVEQLAGARLEDGFPGEIEIGSILPAGSIEQHVSEQDQSEQPSIIRKVEREVLPSWLRPGSYDWNKQVERNGIEEMQERRQSWFNQHRAS